MKKIFLTGIVLCLSLSASAWNKHYDQSALLFATDNMTPQAKEFVTTYFGENYLSQVQTFAAARKKGNLMHTAEWHTLHLDANLNPVMSDENNAAVQIERATEVIRNRASKSEEEIKFALHTIIELLIDMHNVGNVYIEDIPLSKMDFPMGISNGGRGDREKFAPVTWKYFWSYKFSVFHSVWSPQMFARDLAVCHGRDKEKFMAGNIQDWAKDWGAVVKAQFEWAYPNYPMSREEHSLNENTFYAGVARAGYRIAALLNEIVK